MLSKLSIRNIALIDRAEIDFQPGLNILSGETGAGKSIIIDSMNLALGMRADREIIQSGCQEASVEAVFQIAEMPEVKAFLEQWGIDAEDELILFRRLNTSGRSTCRVNGFIVLAAQLRELTARLIDIHGQHEHQSLLDEKRHLSLLDAFGGQGIAGMREQTARAYKAYADVRQQIRSLYGSEGERERRMDVLQYQTEEIGKAKLKAGEEEQIRSRMDFLRHARQIGSALNKAGEMLSGHTSALEQVSRARQELEQIAGYGTEFVSIASRLEQAYYELEDIGSEIRGLNDQEESDPMELEELDSRLDLIRRLNRKYGGSIESVLRSYEEMEEELQNLQGAEEALQKLNGQLEERRQEFLSACEKLSAHRKQVAETFAIKVVEQLADLGMPNSKFEVHFAPVGEDWEKSSGSEGYDDVAFMISTNRGEPLKPLAKTASGGEVSRIMLALKYIMAEADRIPTLIFDEIDAGISGSMARVVAEKLAAIASRRQIICVTHSAQIAAMGDTHFRITKTSDDRSTRTDVNVIEGENRVEEIGRLVGGDMSELGLEHARSMLEFSAAKKKVSKAM